MSEKITRVLVTFDNTINMKKADPDAWFSRSWKCLNKKSGKCPHEWLDKSTVNQDKYERTTYTAVHLPPYIGVYYEGGVHNERIWYKKFGADPMYLYHADDGETSGWFVTRGFPFVGDLYRSEPTTAYQPLTTMGSGLGGLVLEVLEDKEDAKKTDDSQSPNSYFEINRINKINKLIMNENAELRRKLELAEQERANKSEQFDFLIEEQLKNLKIEAQQNNEASTASAPKNVRSSA